MKLIVCVDGDGGMFFNGRRQSRDRRLIEKVAQMVEGSRLWVNAYSYPLFEAVEGLQVCVDEEFLTKCKDDDFCFVENVSVLKYMDMIDRLILFRWNRRYPSDFKLELDLEDGTWKCVQRGDFQGFSHDVITREVYERVGQGEFCV